MRCPTCECEVSEKASFCPMCGSELGTVFCSACGNVKGSSGITKIDKFTGMAIILGIAGYFGYAYIKTHGENVQANVTAGVEQFKKQGEELVNRGTETGTKLVSSLIEKLPDAEANKDKDSNSNNKENEGKQHFEMVADKEVSLTDSTTHDMKAIVGPDLNQTELIAIAHAILDDRIVVNPDDIFVLAIFDGDPDGSISLAEKDPSFIAKFLYLSRLHLPGENIPKDYIEIGQNLFMKY